MTTTTAARSPSSCSASAASSRPSPTSSRATTSLRASAATTAAASTRARPAKAPPEPQARKRRSPLVEGGLLLFRAYSVRRSGVVGGRLVGVGDEQREFGAHVLRGRLEQDAVVARALAAADDRARQRDGAARARLDVEAEAVADAQLFVRDEEAAREADVPERDRVSRLAARQHDGELDVRAYLARGRVHKVVME